MDTSTDGDLICPLFYGMKADSQENERDNRDQMNADALSLGLKIIKEKVTKESIVFSRLDRHVQSIYNEDLKDTPIYPLNKNLTEKTYPPKVNRSLSPDVGLLVGIAVLLIICLVVLLVIILY